MKSLFAIFVLEILLNSCNNSGRIENTVDFLHDIAPFTPDSLVNAIIEIPAGIRQKWEVNKTTGQIEREQATTASFRVIDYLPYPANYGFVPQTLLAEGAGGDGDPVDVFVLGSAMAREEIVKVRIVGIIRMLDNDESDSKLLAVSTNEHGFNLNSYKMLINKYPGAVEIIKLWLLNYKGAGIVKMLSVNDEKDAFRYLNAAHIDYINQK